MPHYPPKALRDALRASFELAGDTHGRAISDLHRKRAEARELVRKGESHLRWAEGRVAKEALAAWRRAGIREAGRWLVWWWNNGTTSPREALGAPCITDPESLPPSADVAPVT